jgi:hypothetical protein
LPKRKKLLGTVPKIQKNFIKNIGKIVMNKIEKQNIDKFILKLEETIFQNDISKQNFINIITAVALIFNISL